MTEPRIGSAFAGAGVLLDASARSHLRLAWRLLRDERVSAVKYLLPALLAVYLLSPIDTIPDFLLGVGQADDLGVAVILVMLTARILPRLAPRAVVAEHIGMMNGGTAASGRVNPSRDQVIDARFQTRG